MNQWYRFKFFDMKSNIRDLNRILEIIIPETDTPGAIIFKYFIRFVDSYLHVTLSNSHKKAFAGSI